MPASSKQQPSSTAAPPSRSEPAPRESAAWGHRVLWRFGRPHTLIGTTLAVAALFTLAAVEARDSSAAGLSLDGVDYGLLTATWLAALAANVFVVGLNQLTDVPIDRMNKPHLPIAAGHLTAAAGRRIVWALAVLALGLAAILGPWLLATVSASMAVGTAYSLPPVRLKRRAVPAALAIASVRGPVVNLGLYGHFRAQLDGPAGWPVEVLLLAAFFFLFTLGIAVAKDVGDVAGDRRHHIATVAVRHGEGKALRLALALLASPYLLVIVVGLWLPLAPSEGAMPLAHAGLLGVLLLGGASVRLADPRSIARWYRGIWRLFYVEYALWPVLWLWFAP